MASSQLNNLDLASVWIAIPCSRHAMKTHAPTNVSKFFPLSGFRVFLNNASALFWTVCGNRSPEAISIWRSASATSCLKDEPGTNLVKGVILWRSVSSFPIFEPVPCSSIRGLSPVPSCTFIVIPHFVQDFRQEYLQPVYVLRPLDKQCLNPTVIEDVC